MGSAARHLDTVVTWGVAAVAAVAAARTVAALVLAALACLPGAFGRCCARLARTVTPVVLRRLLTAGLGLGTAAAPLLPASAQVVAGVDRAPLLDRSPAAGSPALPDLDRGGPPPPPPDVDRAPGASAPSASAATASAPVKPHGYVVRPGDTLWGIAARHLPPGASDAVVDASWRRWYRVNRAVIGPDPDVIVPGQRLVPPTVP